MAETALTAEIQEAYIQGILTRSVDDLVQAMGAYSDEAGRGFRFEAGRHSEAKPATGPI